MVKHGEIAKVAYELYEQSGRIEGRDLDNWLEAERIVMARLAIVHIYKETKKSQKKTAAKTVKKKTK